MKTVDQVLVDCSTENWDGYGALPVNLSSVHYAKKLLDTLPREIRTPDIGADPDGEVSLEWTAGPRQVISISISHAGDLAYAGLLGDNKIHGTIHIDDWLGGLKSIQPGKPLTQKKMTVKTILSWIKDVIDQKKDKTKNAGKKEKT